MAFPNSDNLGIQHEPHMIRIDLSKYLADLAFDSSSIISVPLRLLVTPIYDMHDKAPYCQTRISYSHMILI